MGSSVDSSTTNHGIEKRSRLDSRVCGMNLSELNDVELQKLVNIYCGQTEEELDSQFKFLDDMDDGSLDTGRGNTPPMLFGNSLNNLDQKVKKTFFLNLITFNT